MMDVETAYDGFFGCGVGPSRVRMLRVCEGLKIILSKTGECGLECAVESEWKRLYERNMGRTGDRAGVRAVTGEAVEGQEMGLSWRHCVDDGGLMEALWWSSHLQSPPFNTEVTGEKDSLPERCLASGAGDTIRWRSKK